MAPPLRPAYARHMRLTKWHPGFRLVAGSLTISNCLCAKGYTGTITDPKATCTQCETGTFKDSLSAQACQPCPSDSTTLAGGAIDISSCRCDVGYFGLLKKRPDTCSPCNEGISVQSTAQYPRSHRRLGACGIGAYADTPGSTACTPCPPSATTVTVGAAR
jgi:hypothetical protein